MNLIKIKKHFPDSVAVKGNYVDRYNPYSLSRYKRKEVILEDVFHYKTMQDTDMTIETEVTSSYVVKASDENRLDLIAMKFYGNAMLYWAIAYFNNIADPFNVPRGTVLTIPTKTALYTSGGPLS